LSDPNNIFVSVGSTANEQQEAFVCAVEARLRAEGLMPHTVGRDTFSADAPLKAVSQLMDKCSGAVVIALERMYFPAGIDKPNGPKATELLEIRLATPWNQIEAAMSYARDLPLLMIVERGLKAEGLLERGYDWFVQEVTLDPSSLATLQFNGVLADWKTKVQASSAPGATAKAALTPDNITLGQFFGSLKPAQLWSLLVALAAVVAGAFSIGAKLGPGK